MIQTPQPHGPRQRERVSYFKLKESLKECAMRLNDFRKPPRSGRSSAGSANRLRAKAVISVRARLCGAAFRKVSPAFSAARTAGGSEATVNRFVTSKAASSARFVNSESP